MGLINDIIYGSAQMQKWEKARKESPSVSRQHFEAGEYYKWVALLIFDVALLGGGAAALFAMGGPGTTGGYALAGIAVGVFVLPSLLILRATKKAKDAIEGDGNDVLLNRLQAQDAAGRENRRSVEIVEVG